MTPFEFRMTLIVLWAIAGLLLWAALLFAVMARYAPQLLTQRNRVTGETRAGLFRWGGYLALPTIIPPAFTAGIFLVTEATRQYPWIPPVCGVLLVTLIVAFVIRRATSRHTPPARTPAQATAVSTRPVIVDVSELDPTPALWTAPIDPDQQWDRAPRAGS